MAAHNLTKEAIKFLSMQESYNYDDDWDLDFFEEEDGEVITVAQCPQCKRSYNIVHSECGEYVDLCTCPPDVSENIYHCFACNVTFNTDGEDLETMTPKTLSLFDDDDFVSNKSYYKSSGYSQASSFSKKCSHKHDKIELTDGYYIYCSSVNVDSKIQPDFGLYADFSWRPTWRNEFITWPDYKIPTDRDMALVQMTEAYERILQGEMVEIGCIGGHGRTGTILACIYLLANDGEATPKEAFDFVKQNYCKHAIESDIQEWFISYASHVWFGTELTAEPAQQTYTTVSQPKHIACSATNHYSMMIRGWTVCADKEDGCAFWKSDFEKYEAGTVHPEVFAKANEKESLEKYDYMYGGMRLDSDRELSPCKPIDHYAMILNGHAECIRLGNECNWWESDFSEYINKGTINQVSTEEWKMEADRVKFYTEFYPTAEELEEGKDEF